MGSLRLTSLTCPYPPAPGLALSPRYSLLYPGRDSLHIHGKRVGKVECCTLFILFIIYDCSMFWINIQTCYRYHLHTFWLHYSYILSDNFTVISYVNNIIPLLINLPSGTFLYPGERNPAAAGWLVRAGGRLKFRGRFRRSD